jgi:acyl-CoA synthetase (AMP-forming)/AMP-acid ligase II
LKLFDDLRWTHSQLQHGADLLAVALYRHGLQPRSTITVILSGRSEFHLVLRAATKLNCPFSPINLRSPKNAKEIRHMLTLTKAKAVLIDNASIVEDLENNVPDLMRNMQVKVVLDGPVVRPGYVSLGQLIETTATDQAFEEASTALDAEPRYEDDVVYIGFTSGTTSLPKAVPHTNLSFAWNMRSWQDAFALDHQRVWLHILPMNSIVGSIWTLAYLVSGGSVTHVQPGFDTESIAAAIASGGYTDMLAVPSMIDLLAANPFLDNPHHHGLDRLIVGGSKILRSHVEKAFLKIRCRRLSAFFGMTEGTSVCHETLTGVPVGSDEPIYAGYVNPGCKVRICDPSDTKPVPRGIPGELVQGGHQRVKSYLGGQGQDSFFVEDGEVWYRCGDQAVMMPDGRIAIVGRYKGEQNISSRPISVLRVPQT